MASHFSHPSSAASSASYPTTMEIEQQHGAVVAGGVVNTFIPGDAPASRVNAGAAAGADLNDHHSIQQQTQQDAHLADLVSSREAEVSHLQATLAVPLANWNAKFLWHSIMKSQRECDPAFTEKIKNIHKTFYLPPAIAFYALWLHHRFWYQMPKLYLAVESHLPTPSPNGSSSSLSKASRASIVLYMLAASLANKHLDDFSYRNSSWFEAAKISAADFLEIELLAMKELEWSLEISQTEWRDWIDLLRDANLALERTRPTMESFHWVVGGVLQETWVAIRGGNFNGTEKDVFKGSPSSVAVPALTGLNGKPTWNETSPTLVPSNGTSPPTYGFGLDSYATAKHGHSRQGSLPNAMHQNANYNSINAWHLQRKLEQIQSQQQFQQKPFAQTLNARFIPWDTTLDPVVHVQGRSRANSVAGPAMMMTKGAPIYGRRPADMMTGTGHARPMMCSDILAFAGEEWCPMPLHPQPHQILKTCNAASAANSERYLYGGVGAMWAPTRL